MCVGAALASQAAVDDANLRPNACRYAGADDPTLPIDLGGRLAGLPQVTLPSAARRGGRVDAAAVDAFRALSADVAWYLGPAPLHEPTPALAAWGTLALNPVGGARGTRAVLDGVPATETRLRRVADERGTARTVDRVRTSTQRISVTVNRAEHVRHAAELVAGVVGRLSAAGPRAIAPSGGVSPDASAADRAGAAPKADAPPGGPEVVRLAARIAGWLVAGKLAEAHSAPRWLLAYQLADAPESGAAADGSPPALDPSRFTEILPPSDGYWADPFPAEHDGRMYVFCEEHLAGVRDAHLCAAELNPACGLVDARVVPRRPYHLSFPSVFPWQGAWYMTPETMTERAVPLCRAVRFPDEWQYVGDLVAGERFVDPVIADVDGTWWMFAGAMPAGAAEATVPRLYHAPTRLGPWEPHRRNPAAVDVRAERPAGGVFRRAGAYLRPVQDGAPPYGHAMVVHRIDGLTPDEFRETPVERVEPTSQPGLVGTHTLNAAERPTVLDALRRALRP
jgi:hypothetical protein